jgi:cytochrome c peroxidase
MQRLKLFVLASFAVLSLGFYFSQLHVTRVEGRVSGGQLAVPTSVTASDGAYASKVGLHWDTIRNATLYRVFRNTANIPESASDVGLTAANYYFDASAEAGQTYFYWVRAENGSTVSALSSADEGTRAVGTIMDQTFPPLEPPVAPPGNEMTAAKAYLGKALFWDEQLSSTKTVSCGTCHRPDKGGSDPRTVINSTRSQNPGFDGTFNTADDVFASPGVPQSSVDGIYTLNPVYGYNEQVTGRKAPSYLNSGYSTNGLFWDGRATEQFHDQITGEILLAGGASLESQSAGPPVSPAEMGHTNRDWSQVASRVAASKPLALASNVPSGLRTWIGDRTYPELFQEVFGTPDVTPARISMAIATHERTLFSDQTPLDRWASGLEQLSPQEDAGRQLFVSLQCNACHAGSLLSNHSFQNIGVRPPAEDKGRGAITLDAGDDGKFKTPTLRNVELHGPYMHNGRFATLEDVVGLYNRGGDFDAPNIDHALIRPLNLTFQERGELAAFMKRPLTDPRVRDQLPPFDRPQLYTESNRIPVVTGTGRSGSGGVIPKILAIEPPVVGNPSFTVCVTSALGGANGVLVVDAADPGVGTVIPAAGSLARITTSIRGGGSGDGYASVNFSIPNNPAIVGRTFYARWYVSDAAADNGFSVSPVAQFTIFGDTPAHSVISDFDGDRRSDISVWRASSGVWYSTNSSNGSQAALQFGTSGDRIVPGDYDGDGRTDQAVFRPSDGNWYVQGSSSGFTAFPFGTSEDLPVQGDFDGDGRTDMAVFRPSSGIWYVRQSRDGFTALQFGTAGDKPVTGDYDGDGKSDMAVFRPSSGVWYILGSSSGFSAVQFGLTTDRVIPADYDGDGKTDIAVYRGSQGVWYIMGSASGFEAIPFGLDVDVPSPGDFDGDGHADICVFRPSEGTWYRLNSSNSAFFAIQYGVPTDQPTESGYVPGQ